MAQSTQLPFKLPSLKRADYLVNEVHKRAFFGRLEELGLAPQSQKEAAAQIQLSMDLLNHPQGSEKQASSVFGEGPFAQALNAYRQYFGGGEDHRPGFPKQADEQPFGQLPELPQSLIDGSYDVAHDLARDPEMFGAALVKRAHNDKLAAEAYAQYYGSGDGQETQESQQE